MESLIQRGLAELAIAPGADAELPGRLARLALLLERWSARVDLTGHRSAEDIARRLLLDAIALGGCLEPVPSLVDLGSGAGVPGIPLALLWPETRVVLVEARERRHHFQREAIRALELRNVTAVLGRAEELAPVRSAAVVAQALARPEVALPWMRRWAEPGGALWLPRSSEPVPSGEITGWDGPPPLSIPYQVPLGGPERSVWIYRTDEIV